MSEDMTGKIINQVSENIQKLSDLSTRMDERIKTIQQKQCENYDYCDKIHHEHALIVQRLAVLESKDCHIAGNSSKIRDLEKSFYELDKRILKLEESSGDSKDRWNKIFTFIIQIIWVILAAWLLMKMGLQSPAVP